MTRRDGEVEASPVLFSARQLALLALALLFTLSNASALDPHQPLRHYGQRVWQTENGLPENTVHAILQTRDGYIWLATEGGLVRFDGGRFTVFDRQNTPGLHSSDIRALHEDAAGSLWIATTDGLTRLTSGVFQTFTTADGLPSDTTSSLFESPSGSLCAVTSAGLAIQQGTRFTPVTTQNGLPSNNVSALASSPDGALWVGTSAGLSRIPLSGDPISARPDSRVTVSVRALASAPNGTLWIGTPDGLLHLTPSGITRFTTANGLPANNISSLQLASDGALWIGTPAGAAVLRSHKILSFTTAQGLPGNRIEALFEDREATLWISTSRGLARLTNANGLDYQVSSFTRQDGLSAASVLALFEDREGSLWLGTESGGLDQLRDLKFSSYTTANGLSDNSTTAVLSTRDGTVWTGTNGGGLNRLSAGKFTALTTADGLSSNIILALAEGSPGSGDVWIGTPDGLNHIQAGRVTLYTSADGLADDFVRSLYADPDGALWIGTRRGLSRYKDGRFITYTHADGLASDLIGAITRDRNGDLLVGTFAGLSRLRNGRLSSLTTTDGLSSNIVTALQGDSNGSLWIGTNGGGLNRLANGTITAYPASLGLPEIIYAILADPQGYLWLSSSKGIFRILITSLDSYADGRSVTVPVSAYGIADGMPVRACAGLGHPAATSSREGALWFATPKGLASIDSTRFPQNTLPPPVAIERILVDDRELTPAEAANLAPGHVRLAFEFAALSYIAPQSIRYRYRLQGFDADWITGARTEVGTRQIASYTNLPPGRYTFHVLAANNDGVWNDTGATYSFRLRPHFYQTWWFYILCLLAAAAIGYLVWQARLRRVQREFNAVLAERNRIAREIHDTLAQGFVGISVQLELVARMLTVSAESAREQLDQTRLLVRESIDEARRSIWNLRSQTPEAGDLPARLSQAAARITAGTAIAVDLRVGGSYRPLRPEVEDHLLRIGQEAVTNAVRHAHPQNIQINLDFESRRLCLRISDDGRGFDQPVSPALVDLSIPGGHFGLVGMRERVAQINGTLTVDSHPGSGTRISAEVPI